MYIVDEMHELSCGAVIYKYINNELYYCLIYDTEYEFPKGHVEPGENEIQTAIREIKEEINIDIILDNNFKESIEFILDNPKGVTKRVVYFLGTYDDNNTPSISDEVSEIKLVKYEEALNLIKFDLVKNILIQANKYLNNK